MSARLRRADVAKDHPGPTLTRRREDLSERAARLRRARSLDDVDRAAADRLNLRRSRRRDGYVPYDPARL